MKVKHILRAAKKFAARHMGAAMVIGGVVTSIMALYFAIKNAPKAAEAVKAEETKKGEPLTFWEKTKTVAKFYAPIVITAVLSLSLFVGSHVLEGKEKAKWMATCTALQTQVSNWEKSADEVLDKESATKLKEKVVENHAEELMDTAPADNRAIIIDESTGASWFGTEDKVKNAVHELNRYIGYTDVDKMECPYFSASEFYRKAGCPTNRNYPIFESVGRNVMDDGEFVVYLRPAHTKSGQKMIILEYDTPWAHDYIIPW